MIRLADISCMPPHNVDKDHIQNVTQDLVDRVGDLQKMLFAQKKHSLLIVFQGIDASGKDGAAYNIFKKCHPGGVDIYSFKKPTEEEFAHDFLWRIHKHTPAKGMIQIFNRSHYEDVLIQRVHGWIDAEKAARRMDAINAFEQLLAFDNNTLVLKFFMYISYSQQEEDLRERIDDPKKHWKHSDNDWHERQFWDQYMSCYEEVINRSVIPWTIVPVDKRWYRDYIIAQKVVTELEKLDLAYPPLKSEIYGKNKG